MPTTFLGVPKKTLDSYFAQRLWIFLKKAKLFLKKGVDFIKQTSYNV